ncbi:hypothetical protein C9374_008974 [Naegleria lovaniensis]|uniref:Uncharacterized protein n=1 Tax=Naegleria lovaniensis TaxID=51637 RepID=A0AA88GEH6_NAELO|nr:uncharacterized protein C9374_008974 [Naegleria lovaniensis]KAG2377889.1 hypothetical protein C9374_008974 [Naegleria lovaniensis]
MTLSVSIHACNPPKVGKCTIFPPEDEWNRDVSNDPVDFMSDCYISKVGGGNLKADFSEAYYESTYGIMVRAGIPFIHVKGNSIPWTSIQFDPDGYGDESDFTSAPIPLTAPIEFPNDTAKYGYGDMHVLALDTDNCKLYELYYSYVKNNVWNCYSNAMFDLNKRNASMFRHPSLTSVTSADAAGLPIYPGLVKYSEVAAGNITHAIRFTVQNAQYGYIAPAKHFGPKTNTDLTIMPYGTRLKLKASFDLSSYRGQALVVLKALKKYGMIFADQGSNWYLSGEPNDNWDSDDLSQLKRVPSTAFEVVRRISTVTRGWTPTTPETCKGVSYQPSNAPVFIPNVNCNSPVPPNPPPVSSSPQPKPSPIPKVLLLPRSRFNLLSNQFPFHPKVGLLEFSSSLQTSKTKWRTTTNEATDRGHSLYFFNGIGQQRNFHRSLVPKQHSEEKPTVFEMNNIIMYSHQVYALPTTMDYNRLLPDTVKDKQELIDLLDDTKNVLNYVLFLGFEKKSTDRLKEYQHFKFKFGRDKLISILKLASDFNTHPPLQKPSFKTIMSMVSDKFNHDTVIEMVNQYCYYINKQLNRCNEFLRSDNSDETSALTDEQFNDIINESFQDASNINTILSKFYEMAGVDPLDDGILNTEKNHPLFLFLRNKARLLETTKDLKKHDEKLKNINLTNMSEMSKEELTIVTDMIQKRSLLQMSTLQVSGAYVDITLGTHLCKLLIANDPNYEKNQILSRHVISLQTLMYMYLFLKEYILLVNLGVNYDFTCEDPTDVHHFVVQNFKIVSDQVVLSNTQNLKLDAHLPLAEFIPLLRGLALQFATQAKDTITHIREMLNGKSFKFIDIYDKEVSTVIQFYKRGKMAIRVGRFLRFVVQVGIIYFLIRFLDEKLFGSVDSLFPRSK